MEAIMKKIIHLVKKVLPEPVKTVLKRIIYDHRSKRFKPYLKKKNVEGTVFDFWIGDTDGRDWYDLQCTDPVWAEMRFIKDHMIEPGDVVLECGAHHGCTTILLSKWVEDEGKVVTFEPFHKNCEIVRKNIELNGLKNVTLERKAVGAEKGYIKINGTSNSSVVLSNPGIKVELTCLDDYEHLKPNFLKIDVEGFEHQVLQGAQRILSKRPKLAIEIHTETLSQYGASVEDILKSIAVDNYKLWIQWNDGEEPVEYNKQEPITKRVHLFCIPHNTKSQESA
jgi:FkbM family methyltransferase